MENNVASNFEELSREARIRWRPIAKQLETMLQIGILRGIEFDLLSSLIDDVRTSELLEMQLLFVDQMARLFQLIDGVNAVKRYHRHFIDVLVNFTNRLKSHGVIDQSKTFAFIAHVTTTNLVQGTKKFIRENYQIEFEASLFELLRILFEFSSEENVMSFYSKATYFAEDYLTAIYNLTLTYSQELIDYFLICRTFIAFLTTDVELLIQHRFTLTLILMNFQSIVTKADDSTIPMMLLLIKRLLKVSYQDNILRRCYEDYFSNASERLSFKEWVSNERLRLIDILFPIFSLFLHDDVIIRGWVVKISYMMIRKCTSIGIEPLLLSTAVQLIEDLNEKIQNVARTILDIYEDRDASPEVRSIIVDNLRSHFHFLSGWYNIGTDEERLDIVFAYIDGYFNYLGTEVVNVLKYKTTVDHMIELFLQILQLDIDKQEWALFPSGLGNTKDVSKISSNK